MQKLDYKEVLEDAIKGYKNNPLFFDKRKDRVEYKVENGEIYLRIGDFTLKSTEPKELENRDFQRFYDRLIGLLFDKL